MMLHAVMDAVLILMQYALLAAHLVKLDIILILLWDAKVMAFLMMFALRAACLVLVNRVSTTIQVIAMLELQRRTHASNVPQVKLNVQQERTLTVLGALEKAEATMLANHAATEVNITTVVVLVMDLLVALHVLSLLVVPAATTFTIILMVAMGLELSMMNV
jgi:hypothetical protein